MARKQPVVQVKQPRVLETIPFQEAWTSVMHQFEYYKERHEKVLAEFIERVSKNAVETFAWRGCDIITAEVELALTTEFNTVLSYAAAVQNVSGVPSLRPITDFPHAEKKFDWMLDYTTDNNKERITCLAQEMVRRLDEWKIRRIERAMYQVASNNASTSEFSNLAKRCEVATTVHFLTGTFSVPFNGFRDTLEQVYIAK
jgi:hypothetical protein